MEARHAAKTTAPDDVAGQAHGARAGSDEEQNPHREAWLALCRAYSALTARLQETLVESGLPPLPWFEVLDAVAAGPAGGIRMGDLADALVISKGGLTKLVDKLVRAGLVERAFCEADRRGSYAVLTEAGRRMHEEMEPVVVGELRGSFRRSLSSDEAATLRDALASLTETSCSG